MRKIDIARLKLAMDEVNSNQSDIARYIGVTPAAVQQIVSGKTRMSTHLPRIARYLNVREDWLLGESEERYDHGIETKFLSAMSFRRLSDAVGDDVGPFILLEYDMRFFPFDNNQGATNRFECFTALGDEMAPALVDNDRIVVDITPQPIDRHDGIWIVYIDGELRLRRAARLRPDSIRLYTDDPLTPPVVLPSADVVVYGRVVWMGRELT